MNPGAQASGPASVDGGASLGELRTASVVHKHGGMRHPRLRTPFPPERQLLRGLLLALTGGEVARVAGVAVRVARALGPACAVAGTIREGGAEILRAAAGGGCHLAILQAHHNGLALRVVPQVHAHAAGATIRVGVTRRAAIAANPGTGVFGHAKRRAAPGGRAALVVQGARAAHVCGATAAGATAGRATAAGGSATAARAAVRAVRSKGAQAGQAALAAVITFAVSGVLAGVCAATRAARGRPATRGGRRGARRGAITRGKINPIRAKQDEEQQDGEVTTHAAGAAAGGPAGGDALAGGVIHLSALRFAALDF